MNARRAGRKVHIETPSTVTANAALGDELAEAESAAPPADAFTEPVNPQAAVEEAHVPMRSDPYATTEEDPNAIVLRLGLDGGACRGEAWHDHVKNLQVADPIPDIWLDAFMAQAVPHRHEYLFSHANGAELFHGGSAQILLRFAGTERGLLPASEYAASGRVAFGGAQDQGSLGGGVNSVGLSVAAPHMVDYALDYAQAAPWTPEEGARRVAQLQLPDGYAYEEKRDHNGVVWRSAEDMMFAGGQLERARIAAWPNLSALEQQLTRESFPVLLGIKPRDSQSIISFYNRGMGADEQLLLGGVKPDQVTVLFVPKDRVEQVRELLGPRMASTKVEPLEPALQAHQPIGAVVRANQDELFKAIDERRKTQT